MTTTDTATKTAKLVFNAPKFALDAILATVPKNPPLLILEGILFEIRPGAVNLTACNLQETIETECTATAEESFSFVAPVSIFQAIMKAGSAVITYDPEQMKVTANGMTAQAESAEDWPLIPARDIFHDEIYFNPANLVKASKFVTKDEMRPAMCGINFGTELTGSDGHRLVTFGIPDPKPETFEDFVILPAKYWSKIAKKTSAKARNWSDMYVVLECDNLIAYHRKVKVVYPDFRAVIPQDNQYTATANRTELIQAFEQILPASNKTTRQIYIDFWPSKMELFTKDLDFNTSAETSIFCASNHPGERIAFNGSFLLSILKEMTGQEVTLTWSAPSKPITMKEKGNLFLIMPIIIYDESKDIQTWKPAPCIRIDLPTAALPYLQTNGTNPGNLTEGQIEMLRNILDKLAGYTFTAHRPAGYESRTHKLREYNDYPGSRDPMNTFTFTLKTAAI